MARDQVFLIWTYHLFSAAAMILVCEACIDQNEVVTLSPLDLAYIIQSPNFPGNYPAGVTCKYRFEVPAGYRVRIQFSAFHLEAGSSCAHDSLRLYDGKDEDARQQWTFCGSHVPPNIVTSTRALYVVFSSDLMMQTSGFNASITTVSNNFREPLPAKDPGSCTTYLQHNAGALYSPGYPQSYPEHQDCQYVVYLSDSQQRIKLRFLQFELGTSFDCTWDYVEIRDGLSSIAPLIGRYCGKDFNQSSNAIMSTGPELRIVFHSDSAQAFKGFYAEYTSTEIESLTNVLQNEDESEEIAVCDYSHAPMANRGGTMVSQRGYPHSSYRANTNCSMMFIGSYPDEHIFINVVEMDMPYSIHKSYESCDETVDFLKLTDVAGYFPNEYINPITDNSIFCGAVTGKFTSSSFAAKLQFITDGTNDYDYNGFELVYSLYYIRSSGCENGDFHCSNSRCINASLVCDEYDHCGDKSDEQSCDGSLVTDWMVILIFLACLCIAICGCGYLFSNTNHNKLVIHPMADGVSDDDGQISVISGVVQRVQMERHTSFSSVLSLDSSDECPSNPFQNAESLSAEQPTESIALEVHRTNHNEMIDPNDEVMAENKPYPKQEYTMDLSEGLSVRPSEHQGDQNGDEDQASTGAPPTASVRLPPLSETEGAHGNAKLPPLLTAGPEFKRTDAWGTLPPIRGVSKTQTTTTPFYDDS